MSEQKINMPEVIELEKLTLKKSLLEDLEKVYLSYKENSELLKIKTFSVDDVRRMIEDDSTNWNKNERFAFYIFDKQNKYVGNIVLMAYTASRGEYEFGYTLNKKHQGRGYISQALNCLIKYLMENKNNAHRLVIRCELENTKSVSVALRNGFLLESIQYSALRGSDFYCFVKLKDKEKTAELEAIQDDLKRIYKVGE